MKLKVLSDLHTEHYPFQYQSHGEDILIFAGDCFTVNNVHDYIIDVEEQNPSAKVIIIPGNHEYYHEDFDHVNREFKSLRGWYPNVRFLLNEGTEVNGVNFFGGTMFSDLSLHGDPMQGALEAKFGINDFWCIQRNKKFWTIEDHLEQNEIFLRELKTWKSFLPPEERSIVISHFSPVKECQNPKFPNSPMNPYFCNDIAPEVHQDINLWISGHGHNNFDFIKNGTRFVANQRGYSSSKRTENPDFNPSFVLEI